METAVQRRTVCPRRGRVLANGEKVASGRSPSNTEEIALRAYHIYLERRGAPGNPLEDWTRAERELLEKPSEPGANWGRNWSLLKFAVARDHAGNPLRRASRLYLRSSCG